MKIIQLINSLSSGGAEKFVVDLSNQLAENGNDVTICILLKEKKEFIFNKQFISPKVKFFSFNAEAGFSISKYNKVNRYIRIQKPDVVHCHLNVIPYIFKMAMFNRKIKFFHTLHNVASNTGGVGLQYYVNRFFYRNNLIRPVCISKLCQKSYEEYYRLYNAPYIDNGRSIVNPSEQFEEIKREIESYKHSPNTKVFVHVARFNKQKNQDLLIDSFNKLDKENCDYTLLIIGKNFDTPGGRKLQEKANKKIRFLGEKNHVNDYLLCSDAFCLSSIYEGLPISLLEALACGITPICTSVGGITDVIIDGQNGYLSEGLDVENYCQAIKKFIKKAIDKDTLINFYRENYSMEICAEKYEKLFRGATY